VAGIILMASGQKQRFDEIPFGPMLVTGAVVMIFFGPQIVDWWLGYAGLR
jgi:leader peptidase (prepilin peptidase)/N-methyltransferase